MRTVREIKEEIISLERLKNEVPELAVDTSNTIAGLRWVLDESPREILIENYDGDYPIDNEF